MGFLVIFMNFNLKNVGLNYSLLVIWSYNFLFVGQFYYLNFVVIFSNFMIKSGIHCQQII